MIRFENSAVSQVFVLPREVEKYIKTASAAEIRVILHIFASGGIAGNESDIAAACGITESDVYSALAFWRGTGIISYTKEEKTAARVTVVSDTPASEKNISYSAGELADAIESDEDIRSLLNFASQKIGKVLTQSEQAAIYSLVDVLGLKCDLVMGIIEYCTSEGKKSIRYIERTAAKMRDEDGVDTYEKFEEYITRKAQAKTYEAAVRRIIGAENRGFTKRELEIIAAFAADGISEDLISAAYERTINNIAKPSLVYMSRIIDNWKSEGIKSTSELEQRKPYDGSDGTSEGAFRLEDFTERPDDFFEEDGC